MSGDRPTERDLTLPVHGTAAGSAYLALPPTAVDARPAGPTGLIVAWPGFDPPRAAAALATAMPMTGVPVWRVYLELPGDAEGAAGGLGSGAILESRFIEAYGAAVEEAAERLPDALADIRRDLGLDEGPVGLAGFSAGGSAALLAVARGRSRSVPRRSWHRSSRRRGRPGRSRSAPPATAPGPRRPASSPTASTSACGRPTSPRATPRCC